MVDGAAVSAVLVHAEPAGESAVPICLAGTSSAAQPGSRSAGCSVPIMVTRRSRRWGAWMAPVHRQRRPAPLLQITQPKRTGQRRLGLLRLLRLLCLRTLSGLSLRWS